MRIRVPTSAPLQTVARTPSTTSQTPTIARRTAAPATFNTLIARSPDPTIKGGEQAGESLQDYRKRKTTELKGQFAPVVAKYKGIAEQKLNEAKADFSAMTAQAKTEKVEAKHTDFTAEELTAALKSAWQKIFKQDPPASAISLIVGKWQAEGGSTHNVYNYNIGNQQVPVDPYKSRDKGLPYDPSVNVDGEKKGELPYHELKGRESDLKGNVSTQSSRYFAYSSLEQGVMGLLNTLVNSKKPLFGVLVADGVSDEQRQVDYVKVGFGVGYFTAMPFDMYFQGKKVEAGYLGGIRQHAPTGEALKKLVDGAATPGKAADPDPPPPPAPADDGGQCIDDSPQESRQPGPLDDDPQECR